MRMSRETLHRFWDREEGMTVLEVAMSVFILFFVMTALFSVVAASTTMGVQSKERTLMVNTVDDYVEWVRTLDYDDVGEPGESVDGTLTPRTLTFETFTLDIVPTVTWVNDPGIPGAAGEDYKKLVVEAIVTPNGGGVPVTHSITTYIRDRAEEDYNTLPEGAGDLTIVFGDETPDSETVIWGTTTEFGGVLTVDADAAVTGEGSYIQYFRYYCDTRSLVTLPSSRRPRRVMASTTPRR
jgi:hypothetical protein